MRNVQKLYLLLLIAHEIYEEDSIIHKIIHIIKINIDTVSMNFTILLKSFFCFYFLIYLSSIFLLSISVIIFIMRRNKSRKLYTTGTSSKFTFKSTSFVSRTSILLVSSELSPMSTYNKSFRNLT